MSESLGDHARRPGALSVLFTGIAENAFTERLSTADPDSPGEKERQIMLGQLVGTVAGHQERYHVAGKSQKETLAREKKRKQEESDLIVMLDVLRRHLERFEAAVAAFEVRFEEQFGDAWREQIALEVLGADAIPQQRESESINEYRERLEAYLIAEMLHPDGSMKGRYRDDANTGDYAQWAQTRFYENRAKSLVQELEDPGTTPERRGQLMDEFEARGNLEELTFADRFSHRSKLEIKDVLDSHLDKVVQQSQEFAAADFLSSSRPSK